MLPFSLRILFAIVFIPLCFQVGPWNTGHAELPPRQYRELLEIAELIETGNIKKAKKLAKRISQQDQELIYHMHFFKPRKKRGVGFEKDGGPHDGIELKIRRLSQARISTSVLKKEKEDLLDLIYRVKAVNLIFRHLPPRNGKHLWDKYCCDLDQASDDFAFAVKEQHPVLLYLASVRITKSCQQCHVMFR